MTCWVPLGLGWGTDSPLRMQTEFQAASNCIGNISRLPTLGPYPLLFSTTSREDVFLLSSSGFLSWVTLCMVVNGDTERCVQWLWPTLRTHGGMEMRPGPLQAVVRDDLWRGPKLSGSWSPKTPEKQPGGDLRLPGRCLGAWRWKGHYWKVVVSKGMDIKLLSKRLALQESERNLTFKSTQLLKILAELHA